MGRSRIPIAFPEPLWTTVLPFSMLHPRDSEGSNTTGIASPSFSFNDWSVIAFECLVSYSNGSFQIESETRDRRDRRICRMEENESQPTPKEHALYRRCGEHDEYLQHLREYLYFQSNYLPKLISMLGFNLMQVR